ncbi:MAG: Fic family protein [Bacteroidetes bacterium]|nr:Fic family protein [Bacteroidota bacterium]
MTLKFTKGAKKIENDNPLFKDLCVSSLERALLENLSSSRTIGGESRTVTEEVIEEKLLIYLNKSGEKGLNELRDKTKAIASRLRMKKEFEKLNKKISAILSTKPSRLLKSPIAMAQAFGEPYDPERVNLFHKLAGVLRTSVFETRPENASNLARFKTFAFFEGYFSNYIEGTTFDVSEAAEIIFENKIIRNRYGDSHDVKGTYEICSDKKTIKQTASNGKEFIELLQSRHAVILRGRPDKEPGLFKEKPNRAGNTWFVSPAQVKGTLKAGFDTLSSISSPLGRAIYMMFLVSEVHPFNDGNGRVGRIMMNSELVNSGEQRILIPTVYREDYVGALRKLTRQREPESFIRMLDRIHKYSKWLQPNNYESMLSQLQKSNAFEEPENEKLEWE